ncbi:hypothetical protein MPH_08720 [Macrophomina phaseolina MS6]|uniref:NAD(P)-binding domain-containing protein n=1 Tax=Macrophomina phaseolina (strain MS6) TaxID=1126212 RepID=K2SB61_MACPH|nr:hypothetical protein MPH_08720 [Macrophomina phaseolina MS6]
MATSSTQTFAFLGATGGCTLPVLAQALLSGHHATTLARTPEKLRKMLIEARKVPESVLANQLTIVPGSSSDTAAIRTLLVANGPQKALATVIVSGIGSYPKMNGFNLKTPLTLEDPHITETAMRNVADALKGLLAEGYRVPGNAAGKPLIIAISTTGVTRGQRDVPLLYLPLYHWALAVMHKDKRAMEDVVIAAKQEGVSREFVIVRPSLLTDGAKKGPDAVRVGWENADGKGNQTGPAIGYTICREDVAAWIWEEAVLKEDAWKGKCVSLTH